MQSLKALRSVSHFSHCNTLSKSVLAIFIWIFCIGLNQQVIAQAGGYDLNFGNQGKLVFNLGQDSLVKSFPNADGSLILVTKKQIYKFNADGSPDLNFGTAANGLGKAMVPGYFQNQGYYADAIINADGGITAYMGLSMEFEPQTGVYPGSLAAYFKSNGTIDSAKKSLSGTINHPGIISLENYDNYPRQMLKKENGFAYSTVAASIGVSRDFSITNGFTQPTIHTNTFSNLNLQGNALSYFDIIQQFNSQNQKIVARTELYVENIEQMYLVINRYNFANSSDLSFGSNGVISTLGLSVGLRNSLKNPRNFIIQSDNKMLFHDSELTNGVYKGVVVRLLPTGALDAGFGNNGFNALENTRIDNMTLQSEGKIVVTGTKDGQVILARLLDNGTLDPSFGNAGIFTTGISANGRHLFNDAQDNIYQTAVGTEAGTGNLVVTISKHKNTPLPGFQSTSWLSPTQSSLTLRAKLLTDGGNPISERGIIYAPSSVNTNPEIGGAGVIQIPITSTELSLKTTVSGLLTNTAYHFRGYAINDNGTGYSRVDSATTNREPGISNPERSVTLKALFRPGFDQADSLLSIQVVGKLFQPDSKYTVKLMPNNTTLGAGIVGTDSLVNKIIHLPTGLTTGIKNVILQGDDFQGNPFTLQSTFTINADGIVVSKEDATFISAPENQTLVGSFTAANADQNAQQTSLNFTGSHFQRFFGYDNASGIIRYLNAPDRELPFVANNLFTINLQAADDGSFPQSLNQKIVVQVQNVVEKAVVNNPSYRSRGITASLHATAAHDGGGGAITQKGIVLAPYANDPSPSVDLNGSQKLISGNGTGSFKANATLLQPLTQYAFRGYAINGEGISYTEPLQFTTGEDNNLPFISYDSGQAMVTRKRITPILPDVSGTAIPAGRFRSVEHFAGATGVTSTNGSVDNNLITARFNGPMGMAKDANGNIYVADRDNHTIRMISAAGTVSTIAGLAASAGSTDGAGNLARFNNPEDLVLSPDESFLLVSDRNNHRIRKITLPAYEVSTVAGNGTASGNDNLAHADQGTLNGPAGITMDASATAYFVDNGGNKIRKIVPNTTSASNISLHYDGADYVEIGGTGDLNFTNAMTVEAWFKVDRFDKQWQTIASKGDNSWRLSRSQNGNNLEFFATRVGGANFGVGGSRNVNDGKWHHVAGVFNGTSIQLYVDGVLDGQTTGASIAIQSSTFKAAIGHNTQQLDRKWAGNIDEVRIWGVARTADEIVDNMYNSLTGNETNLSAYYTFNQGTPNGTNSTELTLSNLANNANIALNGVLTGFALTGTTSNWTTGYAAGNYRLSTFAGTGTSGNTNGAALTATFNGPQDLAFNSAGALYIVESNSHRLRKLVNGQVSNIAGGTQGFQDGIRENAQFSFPYSIAIDGGGALYIADSEGNRIRKVTGDSLVTTFVGSGTDGAADSIGMTATFRRPRGLLLDTAGVMYVSDFEYDKIRKVSLNGFDISPALPKGLTFNHATGEIKGIPLQTTLTTRYRNDFNSNQLQGGTLSGNARFANNMVELTSNAANQFGGLTIPASGSNDKEMRIAFTARTSKRTGGADGFSYSFGPDASATGVSPAAEIGSGSKLSVSFATYTGGSPGIRLQYGAVSSLQTTVSGTMLAFHNATDWIGKELNILMHIDSLGKLNMFVNNNHVFTNISLPADYLSANKSTWLHVFKARTGGATDVHGIDNINISSGGGTAIFSIEGNNYYGKDTVSVGLNINAKAQPVLTALNTKLTASVDRTLLSSPIASISDDETNWAKIGLTSTISGQEGFAGSDNSNGSVVQKPQYNGLTGVTSDFESNLFVADKLNMLIRKKTPSDIVTHFAGAAGFAGETNGNGSTARFNLPNHIHQLENDNFLIAQGNSLRLMTLQGDVTLYSGSATTAGETTGTIASTLYRLPWATASTPEGLIYVTDRLNNRIVRINPSAGTTTAVAGSSTRKTHADGSGLTVAGLADPKGIAVAADGTVYFTDKNRVRKLTTDGLVSTLAGGEEAGNENGIGSVARFNDLQGIVVTPQGWLYVSDKGNNQIKRVDTSGFTRVIAGTNAGSSNGVGSVAKFNGPQGLAFNMRGNLLVADSANHVIREVVTSGLEVVPNLPLGLSLESLGDKFVIVGTPTQTSANSTYTLYAHYPEGTDSVQFDLAVISGKQWNGEVDSSWSNPENWSPAGVPENGSEIRVPLAVPAFPHLNAETIVGDVNMDPGAFLAINRQRLILNGDLNNQVTLRGDSLAILYYEKFATSDTVHFDQSLPGTTNVLKQLRINKNSNQEVALGNTLGILGSVDLLGGVLRSDSNLVLLSTPTNTARISSHETTSNISGLVQVERYLPGNRRKHWRLLGFPYQTGTPLAAITGMSIDFNASSRSMMHYIEQNGDVTPPLNRGAGYSNFTSVNDSIPLNSGISAWVYGSQQGLSASGGTLDADGIRMKSYGLLRETGEAVSVPLSYTPGLLTSGWNMISNPFASSIDWSHPSIIKTNVESAKYGWDPEAQNWTSHNGLTGTNGSDQIIQSGEGFFVRATAADASLSIPQDAKTVTTTAFSHLGKNKLINDIAQTTAEQRSKLAGWKIYGSGQGNPVADQVYLDLTQQDATNGFDRRYDALSMVRTAGVDLSILNKEGTALSLQFDRPLEAPGKTMRIYPIAVRSPKTGSITIAVERVGTLDDTDRYFLFDKTASKYVPLTSVKTGYTYKAAKLYEADRLELHANPAGIPSATDGDYVTIRNNGNINELLQAAIVHQQAKPQSWLVTDMQGRVMQRGIFETPDDILHTLKLNWMSKGNYHFTVIFSNQERQTNPFIHQ
jgi:sugar lactone lactonase YvrE